MHDVGSSRFERWGAAIAGVVAVGAGLGAGAFVAGLIDAPAPMTALATSVIDHAPRAVERWAIDTFGTNDKLALAWSVVGVLAICGALVGYRARLRPSLVLRAAVVLALIGSAITLAGRTSGARALVPVVTAALTGWVTLHVLLRTLDPFRSARSSRTGGGAPVIDRRRFIGLSSASAFGGFALQRAGSTLGVQGLDDRARLRAAAKIGTDASVPAKAVPPVPAGADLGIEGVAPWRVPNANFYRIDTAFVVPRVKASGWKLTIGGMVSQQHVYTYEDLLKRANLNHDVTLMCVSNEVGGDLVGNAHFQGVRLSELLTECGVKSGVEQVYSTSVDGWTCGFPVELALDGRDAMVAVYMNGEPLPYDHGFPARLVIPGIYGYVSATKWVSKIELLRWDDADGFWIPKGWSRLGPVKTSCRIDVPRAFATLPRETVVLGGVAWAQHRGIDKVEVQLDLGEWVEAKLAADGGIDTWRQWSYAWDASAAEPGNHVIRVRATDRNGDLQLEDPVPVAPDGAEGFHSIRVKIS